MIDILRMILYGITIYVLIFNVLYGDMKKGWKLEILFILYLIYLILS